METEDPEVSSRISSRLCLATLDVELKLQETAGTFFPAAENTGLNERKLQAVHPRELGEPWRVDSRWNKVSGTWDGKGEGEES